MSNSESLDLPALLKKGRQLIADIPVAEKKKQQQDLQQQTMQSDFWDKAHAQDTMEQAAHLKQELDEINELQQLLADIETFQLLQEETEDQAAADQLTKDFAQQISRCQTLIHEMQMKKYLSGPYDRNKAILSIHPGQGGTEAMDWAEILERMYLRYFERKDWKFSILNETRGEEAGIKEVSFEVKAPYAYGYLKNEKGTHRLVRLSPFNADNLRQTSFALVEVLPVIDNDEEINLKNEDLEWNFTRAGGPGGQSVNKTNSAVELTHTPSGIVVKSRESRSQVQNKETALKMLKAKLAQKIEQEQMAEINKEKGQHTNASWGTQIRNYVLHPYHLVKDTRTKVETQDTDAVLDGNLDKFIQAEVKLNG